MHYVVYDNGEVRIMPLRSLSRLFEICQYQETPISLEDMKRTVKDGASASEGAPWNNPTEFVRRVNSLLVDTTT